MKRVFILGIICFAITSANAGWFSDLFKKESEPQTLVQAADAGAQIKEKVAEKIDTAKIELAKKLLESATTSPDAK